MAPPLFVQKFENAIFLTLTQNSSSDEKTEGDAQKGGEALKKEKKRITMFVNEFKNKVFLVGKNV